jgi:hypothetical protein
MWGGNSDPALGRRRSRAGLKIPPKVGTSGPDPCTLCPTAPSSDPELFCFHFQPTDGEDHKQHHFNSGGLLLHPSNFNSGGLLLPSSVARRAQLGPTNFNSGDAATSTPPRQLWAQPSSCPNFNPTSRLLGYWRPAALGKKKLAAPRRAVGFSRPTGWSAPRCTAPRRWERRVRDRRTQQPPQDPRALCC